MVRGFYTLASGMLTEQRILDTVSNNVANVKTPGYKRQVLTSSSFNEQLLARIQKNQNKLMGAAGSIVRYADKLNIDYSQSGIEDTGLPFDIAIVGDGFFRLEAEDMERPLLTRNGNFTVDDEGYLILPAGGRVLGEGGPIQVGGGDFVVDEEGYVYVGSDESPVDRLSVAYPIDTANLTIYGEGVFIDNNPDDYGGDEAVHTTSFMQGKLESSNVDMGEETASLMEASRTFQTYSQALKIFDRVNTKAVTEIGKV